MPSEAPLLFPLAPASSHLPHQWAAINARAGWLSLSIGTPSC